MTNYGDNIARSKSVRNAARSESAYAFLKYANVESLKEFFENANFKRFNVVIGFESMNILKTNRGSFKRSNLSGWLVSKRFKSLTK